MPSQTKFALYSLLASLFLLPLSARAHKDDYLDETFVYVTIRRGVMILEYRAKYLGSSRDRRVSPFLVNSPFFEYGLTNHTMIEARLSWGTPETNGVFAGGFLQLRHRFGEEGKHFLDPAIALEYEAEREERKMRHFFVPILVLSKDIGEFNVTSNFLFRTELSPTREFRFQHAVGIRYPARGVRYSLEWKSLGRDQRYLLPAIQIPLHDRVSLKFGVGGGVNRHSPRVLAEILLEIEFGKD